MTVSKDISRLNLEAWRIRSAERERAAELAQKALATATKAKDRGGEQLARLTLADCFNFTMKLDRAAEELERCADLLRDDTPRLITIRLKYEQCYLSFQRGDLSKVIGQGQELMDLIHNKGYEDERAWALLTMGIAYQRLGDPYKALNSYRDAELIMVKRGEKNHISNIRMSIGTALGELGKKEEALEMFQEALYMRLSIGGVFHTAIIIGNIATIHHQLGNYAKALPEWDEAVAYFKKAGGMPLWVQALAGKADTLRELKRLDVAKENLMEAIEAAQAMAPALRINLHLSLSRVYADGLQWADALAQLRLADALMTDITDHTQHVELHSGFHRVFKAMGDTASALSHHEQMAAHRERSINELSATRISQWKALYEVDRYREQAKLLTKEQETLNAELNRLKSELIQVNTSAEKCIRLSQEMLPLLAPTHRERFHKLLRVAERQFSDSDSIARNRILQAHPNLTPAELRVCGMVAMGWSGKEIASRIGITLKGVDKHRSSIRRKVCLPNSVNLHSYLEGLANRG